MSDLPADAITAAAEALNDGLPAGILLDEGPAWRAAKRALEAAKPHLFAGLPEMLASIAAAERQRIIEYARAQARAIRDRNRTITDAGAVAAGTLEDFARLLARGAESDSAALEGATLTGTPGDPSGAVSDAQDRL